MTITDVELILDYRKIHLPAIKKRARLLDLIAARAIIEGLLAYGWI